MDSVYERGVEMLTPPGESLIALGDDPVGFIRQLAFAIGRTADPMVRQELGLPALPASGVIIKTAEGSADIGITG